MTPAERKLLLMLARDLNVEAQDQAEMCHLIAAVETETPPLTPRAKYVSIEHKPDDKLWWCNSCGADVPSLVRIGEYADPSGRYCFTCIADAAQLIEAVKAKRGAE